MSDKNSKKQIQNSTASKPSTAPDTNSQNKEKRWFRYSQKQPELPELSHLFDLYWGGPERRITSLTLKIISVNVIALIMLLFGTLYLAQYKDSIIETKLKNFEREIQIISIALSELDINSEAAHQKILEMISNQSQHIKIFDKSGAILFDKRSNYTGIENKRELRSIKILKNTASIITNFLPETNTIPYYPQNIQNNITHTPDLQKALSGYSSLSAWQDPNNEILLSAGAPITKNGETIGAIILIRQGNDIKEEIAQVWKDILKIFIFTLLITIILSIYLAGAIANPLKKLAKAAEAVRTGQATGEDIPDFSSRHDEIGDLSIVLRAMTDTLWTKMDSIESFAADVSHELKNPLTSLKSAIETLGIVKNKDDQNKLINIINHDINRMDRLITDISAASRLDAELSRETFNTINLDTVIKELLDFYKAPIDRENNSTKSFNSIKTKAGKIIEFHTQSSQNYTIKGSATRLKHVFQNLIDNALSFSKPQDTIHITVNRGENLIAVHIDDDGPGIPTNKLENIFDRFYTERPEEDYGQHSGLGLSICKQIIESHRGEIFAENRHDESGNIIGARFSVILKAA